MDCSNRRSSSSDRNSHVRSTLHSMHDHGMVRSKVYKELRKKKSSRTEVSLGIKEGFLTSHSISSDNSVIGINTANHEGSNISPSSHLLPGFRPLSLLSFLSFPPNF